LYRGINEFKKGYQPRTNIVKDEKGDMFADSQCTGLFISPSGTSELDCATTKTDTAERSISIGGESLKVFFVLGALAYLQVPSLGVVVTKNGVHSE